MAGIWFIHVIWLLSALFHQTCVSFPFIVNLGMLTDQGRGTNLVNIKMFSGEIMIESKSQDIQKAVVLADQVSSSVLATHQCLRAQSRSLTLPQRFPKHCGHVCCMYVLCVSVCAWVPVCVEARTGRWVSLLLSTLSLYCRVSYWAWACVQSTSHSDPSVCVPHITGVTGLRRVLSRF